MHSLRPPARPAQFTIWTHVVHYSLGNSHLQMEHILGSVDNMNPPSSLPYREVRQALST